MMLKLADVAPVSPPALAVSVYPPPELSMDRSLKVASPLTAATTNVPDSVPADGFVPMARVILSVAVGTRLPPASCTCTLTAGVIVAPGSVSEGSTLKASFAALPNVMSKLTDVAVLRPPTVASRV